MVVDTTLDQSFATLQDAVDAAQPGDTLFVKGTCTGAVIATSVTLTGHANGGSKTATIDGAPVGGGTGGSVLDITNAAATVNVNKLIITGGAAAAGGGISNAATLTLNSSIVSDNRAILGDGSPSGGGIYNTGRLTLNNSVVSDNVSEFDGQGPPIEAFGGGITNLGTLTVTGTSVVSGNVATSSTGGAFGGGIFNTGTLNGAIQGSGGNVYGNSPDNIENA